jgi:radical SAM protein with 4Fe4S-binding SPASM domain
MINTYQKHNSFVSILHTSDNAQKVLERVRRLRERLAQEPLSAYQRTVVAQACQDLLGAPSSDDPAKFSLKDFIVDEIDRLSDDDLARYFFYRYRYEVFPERKLLDQYPPLIQVEPTSICNYRCVFCYQTDNIFTERQQGFMGMMSLDVFKRIIDQIAGQCEALTLASRGEPLICKEIVPMLQYIQGKFLALKMNTNASLLNEEKCHAILESGMNTLVFSADAAEEPTYSQFRVGGNLDRVVKNIILFRDIRRKHYPNSRLITRVSGVKVPGTPDLAQMDTFWGEMVDQVAFVTYNPWENVYESPVNELAIPCSDLWRRMFIWWDGTVNPCDVDYRSTMSVGKIHDSSVSSLWRSPGYEKLREHHLSKQRSQCSPCQRCVVV